MRRFAAIPCLCPTTKHRLTRPLYCKSKAVFFVKNSSSKELIITQKSRKELERELAKANAKVEQYQHQAQRLENRLRYYADGERKKRNHRLITRGAAVESIAPEVRSMSERAFFLLVEKVFSLPEVAALVSHATDQQEGD